MAVPEFLSHCSRDLEITKIFILEVSLKLTSCRRNAPNYQENDEFLENYFRLETMLIVCRWRFLSLFGTGHMTQKLQSFFIFEVSLNLTWCRRNAPNYQPNNGILENCLRLQTILKVCRWQFLSFFRTAHVTQKL